MIIVSALHRLIDSRFLELGFDGYFWTPASAVSEGWAKVRKAPSRWSYIHETASSELQELKNKFEWDSIDPQT